MIDKSHASHVRAKISTTQSQPQSYYVDIGPLGLPLRDHGTLHISAVTADGSAVALTSSVNLGLGSNWMDPETGILMNDQMDGARLLLGLSVLFSFVFSLLSLSLSRYDYILWRQIRTMVLVFCVTLEEVWKN